MIIKPCWRCGCEVHDTEMAGLGNHLKTEMCIVALLKLLVDPAGPEECRMELSLHRIAKALEVINDRMP